MKVAFRIECPHCKWGFEWSDHYVNQGWISLNCEHCSKGFYTKITIPMVQVETQIEDPVAPVTSGAKLRRRMNEGGA